MPYRNDMEPQVARGNMQKAITNVLYQDTWITQNGEVLKIKDMDDQHIQNVVNYCKRVGIIFPYMMLEELNRRN